MLDNKKNDILCIVTIFISIFIAYIWTLKLPIIGDGLMHMTDNTDLSSIENWFKIFYTFDGIGKPENTRTIEFHRPIFNEIIIPIMKHITNNNTIYLRGVTSTVHSLNACLCYILCRHFTNKKWISYVGGIIYGFGLTYFTTLYEFGLSFSVWLSCFTILSFIFTVRYSKNGRRMELILAIIFTFLAMFTKESAMTLGIALIIYILGTNKLEGRPLFLHSSKFIILQLGLLGFYFLTRYMKLDSIFVVSAGLDTNITFFNILIKIIGFFLYTFNIPTKIFENYMCVYLSNINIIIAILIVFVPSILVWMNSQKILNNKKKLLQIGICLCMYVVIIAPVFKTNRNSTYYGDIANIPIIIGMIILADYIFTEKKYGIIFYSSVYIVTFATVVHSTVMGNSMYIAYGTNIAMKIKQEIQNHNIYSKRVYVTSNWMRDSNFHYILNHGQVGAFYKYNIDYDATVSMFDEELASREKGIVIGFAEEENTKNIEVFVTEDDGQLIEVKYPFEDVYDTNLEIEFLYNNKRYKSILDINYKKMWDSSQYAYFVIPKDVSAICNIKGSQVRYLQ